MKVLWVTNIIFPEIAKILGYEIPTAGGWMYGLAHSLQQDSSIELHVATIHPVAKTKHEKSKGIDYYLLPSPKNIFSYDLALENHWKQLITALKPDVIHIHGTEYPAGLALMNACPSERFIISIQGFISVCAKYYTAGISKFDILKNLTFRDIARRDSILQAKKKFAKRGKIELEYLAKAKHVIGRTDWDLAHSKTNNPKIKYHFCNETLRDIFYGDKKWDAKTKIDYTIFLSQGYYPLKGLHQIIHAVAIVKKKFPSVKIKVAGGNIIKVDSKEDKLRLSGFGKLIRSLLKKYDLFENIEFLGILSKDEMYEQYLKAHVFVCPSSIENSSNSLGEAQILGLPAIASYVGGNPNMINHAKDGFLYPFEEVEMLAHYIEELFSNPNLCAEFSKNAIQIAEKRHDKNQNIKTTIKIYQSLLNDENGEDNVL